MSRFQPSFYSNPNQPETTTLVVFGHRNPVEDVTVVKWSPADGSVLQLDPVSYKITILEPAKDFGTTFGPGTMGYMAHIQKAIEDYDKNKSWWRVAADYVNYPPERELLAAAEAAGKAALPERQQAVNAEGKPVDAPKPPRLSEVDWPLVLGISALGLAAIGGTIYIVKRRKA